MKTDVKKGKHLHGRLYVAAARVCGHLPSQPYLQLGSHGRAPNSG